MSLLDGKYSAAFGDGYDQGRLDGYDEGYESGRDDGFSDGYEAGWDACVQDALDGAEIEEGQFDFADHVSDYEDGDYYNPNYEAGDEDDGAGYDEPIYDEDDPTEGGH